MADNRKFPSVLAKRLKTDISATDVTFKLPDIKWYTGSDGIDVSLSAADFGTVGYGVWEPNTARQEFFTWDPSTLSSFASGITIVARGLPWSTDYTTEASARKFAHDSGSRILLMTNAPAFYDQFTNKNNDETIAGDYTFSGRSPSVPTETSLETGRAASIGYVNGVAIAGAPNASTTVKGIVEIATGAELAAGTGTGGTGAAVVPAGDSFKNSSAGAGDANKVPVLNASGVLDQTFLNSARTWGAVQSFTADNAQITTDPDSGNDAVRKSYADDTYLLNIFGDGSDGDVTIGTNTTLVRDMFYNNLTLPGSFTINTAGFRIYVRGTFTRSGTGYVFNEGGAGGAGANGTSGGAGAGGTAGTAAPGVTVPAGLAGVVGGAGGASSNNNGNAGTAGLTAALCSTSTAGVAGGAGGAANPSGLTGGAAGGAGSATQAVPPRTPSIMELLAVANGTAMGLIRPAAGSGSGGGGASGNASAGSNFGGGGGGSGASGGHVSVNAYALNDTGSGTMFRANGAVGGNGGNGYVSGTGNQGAGGGGAGSGGNGGSIEIVCKRKTGTCTMTVSGGSPGSVGTGASFGSGSGSNGAAGNTGNSGFSLCLQI